MCGGCVLISIVCVSVLEMRSGVCGVVGYDLPGGWKQPQRIQIDEIGVNNQIEFGVLVDVCVCVFVWVMFLFVVELILMYYECDYVYGM